MDDAEAGRYWEGNAEAWTLLARQGYHVYRDLFNTAGFLEMLPDVTGLEGMDLGCGEGHNTRLVAPRGVRMRGIDVAPHSSAMRGRRRTVRRRASAMRRRARNGSRSATRGSTSPRPS